MVGVELGQQNSKVSRVQKERYLNNTNQLIERRRKTRNSKKGPKIGGQQGEGPIINVPEDTKQIVWGKKVLGSYIRGEEAQVRKCFHQHFNKTRI